MTVDFFTANEQNAPTTGFYLFSKELTTVINGEYVQHNGQTYQVTGQLLSEVKGQHNAFLFPVNSKPVEIEI